MSDKRRYKVLRLMPSLRAAAETLPAAALNAQRIACAVIPAPVAVSQFATPVADSGAESVHIASAHRMNLMMRRGSFLKKILVNGDFNYCCIAI